jgi:hypothetical protein
VEAEYNPQLMLYALGALDEFALAHEINRVRLVIHQPRLDSMPEWEVDLNFLEEFRATIKQAARATFDCCYVEDIAELPAQHFQPTEEGCKFCKAKAICPALDKFVQETVGAAFEDISEDKIPLVDEHSIGIKLKAVDLIEDWCNAVRSKAEERLHNGLPVDGFKLVEGKKGNRKWTDEDKVERIFKKTFRFKADQMYKFKLLSPTDAEKLLKDNPVRWEKVSEFISQEDGKPTVVPESDKRPALDLNPAKAFDDLDEDLIG